MNAYDIEPKIAERFWSFVEKKSKTECWLWRGQRTGTYYGQFEWVQDGRRIVRRAHRLAYVLAIQPISDATFVFQDCENRLCCNPNHLCVGGQHQRMQRVVAKDPYWAPHIRDAEGAAHHNAKLTPEIVRHLRVDQQTPTYVLAKIYGICQQTISDVRRRRTWKHV